ncbi:hypothetical protein P7C73_g3656, partial [Tremellales sp. Uapishka_1]
MSQTSTPSLFDLPGPPPQASDAYKVPPTTAYSSYSRSYFESTSPAYGTRFFIKRSTTPAEWCAQKDQAGTPLYRPGYSKESLQNEALAIAFVKENTTIPVPTIVAAFEDRGCFYIIEEFVDNSIGADQLRSVTDDYEIAEGIVRAQLKEFMVQLKSLKSSTIRSFVGETLFLALAFGENLPTLSRASYIEDTSEPYVLCHGDLAWHNILVDPNTFKILCIIDWENAGFYPPEVEGSFWREAGSYVRKEGSPEDPDHVTEQLYRLRRMGVGGENAANERLAELSNPSSTPEESGLPGVSNEAEAREGSKHIEGKRQQGAAAQDIGEEDANKHTGELTQRPSDEEYISSLDREIRTPLQRRLRELDLDYPESRPITAASLAVQVGITCRSGVAKDYRNLECDLTEDFISLESWREATPHWSNREELHLRKLHNLLPALHKNLAAALDASNENLEHFRDYLARLKERMNALLLRRPEISSLAWREGITDEEDQQYEQWRESIATIRHQELQELGSTIMRYERETWDAFHQFASDLLVLAHSAKSIVPFLTANSKANVENPALVVATNRARHLLAGGSGGWQARVVDLGFEQVIEAENCQETAAEAEKRMNAY